MTEIPENSDSTSPPDSLQQTTYTCGECDEEFGSIRELADHTPECASGD